MLNYLEAFILLSENLSFSKTAKLMHVSQPCISRQITLLEKALNMQLFLRDKHQVSLTPQGITLKNKITPLYKNLIQSLERPKDDGAVTGIIRFGSLTEIGQSFFMKHILEFSKKYPLLRFRIEYLKGVEILNNVKNSKLDFGISFIPAEGENIRSYELFTEESLVVTRAQNNKKLTDYDRPPFVTYKTETPEFFSFTKKLKIKDISVPIAVNSHISMIETLLSKDIFALVPKHCIQTLLNEKKLKVAHPLTLTQKIYLIHADNPHMEKKNLLFKEYLMKICRKKS